MNERGVALPMALIVLLLISSLMAAFAVLATTEPLIAANHELSTRARAAAEAGIERGLWALSHPAEPGGIPDPMGAAAGPPYDGSTYVTVGAVGGFTVRITQPVGMAANKRRVEAIGWSPNNDQADGVPEGVKRIETTAMKLRSLDPPCALCVEGEVEVTGTAMVAVTFNSSNPMPNGIVFVDTTTGDPFTALTPDSEAGHASIHGGTNWSGWVIVAGSIEISGNVTMHGLVYAQNDLSYRGTGTGQIEGAVISENRKDTVATTIDATTGGNADIIYNCDYVRNGGGMLSENWFVEPGTYKELQGETHT